MSSPAKPSRGHLCFFAPTPKERFAAWLSQTPSDDTFSTHNFATSLLPHCRLVSYTNGPLPTATFAYTVQTNHCNPRSLHGGAIATLFDHLTSLALVPVQTREWWLLLGVTRTLNITYLAPAYAGDEVEIFCEVISIGKRMAHLRGTIKDKDGRVVAIAAHEKVNTDQVKSRQDEAKSKL